MIRPVSGAEQQRQFEDKRVDLGLLCAATRQRARARASRAHEPAEPRRAGERVKLLKSWEMRL